jgi:hypothetical protein
MLQVCARGQLMKAVRNHIRATHARNAAGRVVPILMNLYKRHASGS